MAGLLNIKKKRSRSLIVKYLTHERKIKKADL
jgi:hypothetical protein